MMEYSATSPIMYALGISIKSGVKCTVSAYVENGKEVNGYVCARCIRTLKKADAE